MLIALSSLCASKLFLSAGTELCVHTRDFDAKGSRLQVQVQSYVATSSSPHNNLNMASRYGSHLTQREGKSSLFSAYDERQRSTSPSKNKPGSGYSSRYGGGATDSQSAFGAYPTSPYSNGSPSASAAGQFRTATPDKKGRYSDAVLSELESQNDEHISGILGKVGQLKQVSLDILLVNWLPIDLLM